MKNWIGIIVLILLGILAWVLIGDVKIFESTDGPLKDFAIKDTANVDQVFIADPNGRTILLTRRGHDTWTVDGRYPARPDGIKLILKTLHDIKVLSNVSRTTLPRVISRMASSSKKVEFYMNGEKNPEKIWYVGDGTFSRVGTYMLLEKNGKKSTEPFITHLLMERGMLNSRFFTDSLVWKDRVVFKSDPKKIKEIRVEHKYDTAYSYSIKNIGNDQFEVENLRNGESSPVDPEKAIAYFKGFQAVYYEYIDRKSSDEHLDSIYQSSPRHLIEIVMENGDSHTIKSFNMPVKPGSEMNGKPIYFNPERMYLYSSFMRTLHHPIAQNLTFDILVSDYRHFASSTTVEK